MSKNEIETQQQKKKLEKLQSMEEFCDLVQFARNLTEEGYFSQGFEILKGEDGLGAEDGESGLRSWVRGGAGDAQKDVEDFFDKFIPFANANGTGSFYALWIDDAEKPLNQLPVIVFGDEGGVFVVAENFVQLLHLLTYYDEISVDCGEGVYFCRYEYEESDNLRHYLQWVKQNYDLNPVTESEETEKIIKAAQEKYTARFNAWFSQYFDLKDVGIVPWE